MRLRASPAAAAAPAGTDHMRGRTPPRQPRQSGRAHGQSSTQRRAGVRGGGRGRGARTATHTGIGRAPRVPPPSPVHAPDPTTIPPPLTPSHHRPYLVSRSSKDPPTHKAHSPYPNGHRPPPPASRTASDRRRHRRKPPAKPPGIARPPAAPQSPRVWTRVWGNPPHSLLGSYPRRPPPHTTAAAGRTRGTTNKKKIKAERATSLSSCGGDTRRGHGVPPARPGTASTSPCLWGGRRHATSQEEGEEQGADRAGRGRPVGMSRQTAPQPRGEAGTGDMNGREDEHGREGGGEGITKEEGTWLPAAWR